MTGSHTYTGDLACALPSGETGEPHSRTRNKLIINRFKANFDSRLFGIFTAVFVRKNFHLPGRVAVGLLGCVFTYYTFLRLSVSAWRLFDTLSQRLVCNRTLRFVSLFLAHPL